MIESLERVWRSERPRLVGSLARRFGDLDVAEDAVQEAFIAASRRWPIDGVPDRPGAWLHTVAYRKAVGVMRTRRPTTSIDDAPELVAPFGRDTTDDDLLGLLLACCHPALNSEARVALTLRHVCGLNVDEIAAGFVVSEAAMTKRLVRARSKIRSARIPFDRPDDATIAQRIGDIHTVLYVVFTEGHLASGTSAAIRTDLCEEAIWLARQFRTMPAGDDETNGLLALFLIQHARHASRLDGHGQLVRFAEQDREAWDHGAISEARTLLADPDVEKLGPYRLEAAIGALHLADDGPDWARIADLYGVLSRMAPSPIVEVNRAVAVAEADGPRAGLAVLQAVLDHGRLDNYAHAHAVRADLLERTGDTAAAAESWHRAAALSLSPVQRAAMMDRTRNLPS